MHEVIMKNILTSFQLTWLVFVRSTYSLLLGPKELLADASAAVGGPVTTRIAPSSLRSAPLVAAGCVLTSCGVIRFFG
jgi:hypothetical protein